MGLRVFLLKFAIEMLVIYFLFSRIFSLIPDSKIKSIIGWVTVCGILLFNVLMYDKW